MKINFIKSRSFVKPDLFDNTSSKVVSYIRKNIIEIDGGYEYDEAKLTKYEYRKYLAELKTQDIFETIENLKTENKALNEQVDMLTSCILEMSEVVYN